jgi:hypothetical protein
MERGVQKKERRLDWKDLRHDPLEEVAVDTRWSAPWLLPLDQENRLTDIRSWRLHAGDPKGEHQHQRVLRPRIVRLERDGTRRPEEGAKIRHDPLEEVAVDTRWSAPWLLPLDQENRLTDIRYINESCGQESFDWSAMERGVQKKERRLDWKDLSGAFLAAEVRTGEDQAWPARRSSCRHALISPVTAAAWPREQNINESCGQESFDWSAMERGVQKKERRLDWKDLSRRWRLERSGVVCWESIARAGLGTLPASSAGLPW